MIEETNLKDVFVYIPIVHSDERGFFMESYRKDIFENFGIKDFFIQDNHSYSRYKNTIRGLNFQFNPPMSKIMRVTRGSAFLVAVDIRKNSPTFGKWFGIESNIDNKIQLYAPAGFARGFQTLSDDCEVQYKCSALHNDDGENCIVWNDISIGIDWPVKGEPIISERNRNALSLNDWIKKPESNIFIYEKN